MYLSEHIPTPRVIQHTRRGVRNEIIPLSRTERYANSFFPYSIKKWKELDDEAKCKPTLQSFKKYLNSFIRPPGHSFFGIRDKFGGKLRTKMRVAFFGFHRFDHNFNCTSPTCQCGTEDETSVHYFIRCPRYVRHRTDLKSVQKRITLF